MGRRGAVSEGKSAADADASGTEAGSGKLRSRSRAARMTRRPLEPAGKGLDRAVVLELAAAIPLFGRCGQHFDDQARIQQRVLLLASQRNGVRS